MNKVMAVSRWELHQGYAERRYEIYQRVKRGWILLEKGWLRKGSLPTQTFQWVYNPWSSESRIETPNGSIFIYNNLEEFLEVTLVDPEDLLPEWAEAYIII